MKYSIQSVCRVCRTAYKQAVMCIAVPANRMCERVGMCVAVALFIHQLSVICSHARECCAQCGIHRLVHRSVRSLERIRLVEIMLTFLWMVLVIVMICR